MEITKQYEVRLNLSVEDMMNGGLNKSDDRVIMSILRNSFERKCMCSTFILEILKITNRSHVSISKSDLGGSGCVCVTFQARAILYPPGQILVGCKINAVNRATLICNYGHVYINVRFARYFHAAVGDMIIVKLSLVSYPDGSNTVTCTGVPYTLERLFEITAIFSPHAQTTLDEKAQIQASIDRYKKTLAVFNGLDQKNREYFTKLFYPYSNTHSDFPKMFRITSAVDILESFISGDLEQLNLIGKTMFVAKHPMIDKTTPNILIIEPSDLEKAQPNIPAFNHEMMSINTKNGAPLPTLISYLDDTTFYCQMICDLVKNYNTEILRSQHDKMWKYYMANKK